VEDGSARIGMWGKAATGACMSAKATARTLSRGGADIPSPQISGRVRSERRRSWRMGPAWHRYSGFGLSDGGNGPRCADLAQGTDRFNLFLFFSISIFLFNFQIQFEFNF
jgi:hypothetical protein